MIFKKDIQYTIFIKHWDNCKQVAEGLTFHWLPVKDDCLFGFCGKSKLVAYLTPDPFLA